MDISSATDLLRLPLQFRIDLIADDLLSGDHLYESFDSAELAKVLAVSPNPETGWMNHRAWVLRTNLPPGDYDSTPEELKRLRQPWWRHRASNRKISDLLSDGVCYSRYELDAEEALFTRKDASLDGLLKWAHIVSSELILKSTSGVPVRFTQLISQIGDIDIFGPYIDGLDFDPELFHELRFFVEPYNWDILEDQTTYIYEMGCCEGEIWEENLQQLQ